MKPKLDKLDAAALTGALERLRRVARQNPMWCSPLMPETRGARRGHSAEKPKAKPMRARKARREKTTPARALQQLPPSDR
jgi:hypothetical protein